MENESKAYQIGQRLRKARNARGWTQEVLAEKCNVTPQTISKYEKSGLSDVDTVTSLSNVLGTDLWTDEFDSESPVSEIGMEILIQLIKAGGCLPFEELITDHLLGLDRAKATDEVVKLFKTGLCVRERYTAFFDVEFDDLFVTAKGVITCRHRVSNPQIISEISNPSNELITYENILANDSGMNIEVAESMQDYYRKRLFAQYIHELPSIPYRLNEIIYLKRNYSLHIYDPSSWKRPSLFLGWGLWWDLIHSKIIGLTKENVFSVVRRLNDPYRNVWKDELEKYAWDSLSPDTQEEINKQVKAAALEMFAGDVRFSRPRFIGPSRFNDIYKGLDEAYDADLDEKRQEYETNNPPDEYYIALVSYEEKVDDYIQRMFESTYQDRPFEIPENLFTDDELLVYAKDNLRAACTEEELKVDKMISEINRLCPETLRYYDNCSDELLALAEELYGIDISQVKELKE